MTFFENELKKMFGKNEALTDIRCVGNTLVGRLTPETIAKISFINTGIHGHYTTALIRVINPQSGEVDRQGINLSEAFGFSKKQGVHIWDSGDGMTCWCNFTPNKKSYEDINRAAQQYLEMFLEPVQDMGMSM